MAGHERDTERLLRKLKIERPRRPGPDRDLIDAAIKAVQRYGHLRRRSTETDDEFNIRTESEWDGILELVDQFLERRQRRHLRDVRKADASGPDVPDV